MGLYFVHINLYHKYFVLVSDKSGDERFNMLTWTNACWERKKGPLSGCSSKMAKLFCHDGRISLIFKAVIVGFF